MSWLTGIGGIFRTIFGFFFGSGSALEKEVRHDKHLADKIEELETKKKNAAKDAHKRIYDIIKKAHTLYSYLKKIEHDSRECAEVRALMEQIVIVERMTSAKEIRNELRMFYQKYWKPAYDVLHKMARDSRNRKFRKYVEGIEKDFHRLAKDLNVIIKSTEEEKPETAELEHDEEQEAA
ncbi:MAG: hypothetical protein KJ709_09475 [Nanoarchaeota archaeon]|nr:hypothetical protein [Nanoarchaeota archaeon]